MLKGNSPHNNLSIQSNPLADKITYLKRYAKTCSLYSEITFVVQVGKSPMTPAGWPEHRPQGVGIVHVLLPLSARYHAVNSWTGSRSTLRVWQALTKSVNNEGGWVYCGSFRSGSKRWCQNVTICLCQGPLLNNRKSFHSQITFFFLKKQGPCSVTITNSNINECSQIFLCSDMRYNKMINQYTSYSLLLYIVCQLKCFSCFFGLYIILYNYQYSIMDSICSKLLP